jgi:hypothetical protein
LVLSRLEALHLVPRPQPRLFLQRLIVLVPMDMMMYPSLDSMETMDFLRGRHVAER